VCLDLGKPQYAYVPFLREPVAAKTGAATIIPSGTLCTPIAAAMTGPTLVYELNATANPSGRLCRVMVMAISSPRRINRALLIFLRFARKVSGPCTSRCMDNSHQR